MTTRRRFPAAPTLAAFPGAAGVLHFAVPDLFDAMAPGVLPGEPRLWTWTRLSGAAGLVGLAGAPQATA